MEGRVTKRDGSPAWHVHASAEYARYRCTECDFDFCEICREPRSQVAGLAPFGVTECGHPVAPPPRFTGPTISCYNEQSDSRTPYESRCGLVYKKHKRTSGFAVTYCRKAHYTQEEAIECFRQRSLEQSPADYTGRSGLVLWRIEVNRYGRMIVGEYSNPPRIRLPEKDYRHPEGPRFSDALREG